MTEASVNSEISVSPEEIEAAIREVAREYAQASIDGNVSGGDNVDTPDTWHDVRDYGADGDGSDDTEELQEAFKQAEANAEGVYIPSGDYHVDEAVIGGERVPIRGDGGYQSVIHQEDADEHGLDLKGASNLTIEGIGITHDHDLAPQEGGQCLFSGKPTKNVTVRDCAISEPARQGVGFWSGGNENIRFENNDLTKCARAGVVMFGRGLAAVGNYVRATGDDAIALNTDGTTRSIIGGNIVIAGAGAGEQTGGSIKFHGRSMIIGWNVLIRSNQWAIRGQIVDHQSGEGTDISPRRNRITNNLIHGLTDINPETQTRAAIEMREFETVAIENNSLHYIGDHIGVLLRNDAQDDTRARLGDNYIDGAERAVQVEDRHGFIDISDLTVHDVDRVLQIRDPVESLHLSETSGHGISSRCVNFSGVDGGTYYLENNTLTDADTDRFVEGSISGGEVYNRLNTPEGETAGVRDGADSYEAVRWSDLS